MQYRVKCAEHTSHPGSLATAERRLRDTEREEICPLEHVIEVRDGADGAWRLAAEWLASRILGAHHQESVRTFDGELVMVGGGWSRETTDRADAAAAPGTPEWFDALGVREWALLTEDGQAGGAKDWCNCDPEPLFDRWVWYERWTAAGRVAHGYLCPTLSCRGIVQTG